MSKLLDPMTCKQCGGKCCKNCGCSFRPEQFKDISVEGIKNILKTGIVSVDW